MNVRNHAVDSQSKARSNVFV